jgi:hypothetical protein
MKLLLFGIVLFYSVYSYGQDTTKFHYQLNAGATMSVPNSEPIIYNSGNYIKYYSSAGFFVEINFIYNIKNRCSLRTGINYDYNTLQKYAMTDIERLKGKILSQQINLPIAFTYRVLASMPLYIVGGGYIGTEFSKKEKGTKYLEFSMIYPTDPNDPLFNYFQNWKDHYNDAYHNGFTLTYGLTARIEYIAKINKKMGLVVFSGISYGWSNSKAYHFKTRPDLSLNTKFGLGFKI